MLQVAGERVAEHRWDNVELDLVPDLRVRELAFGAGYLAVGHTPGDRPLM
jgi:hypothetical protein